MKTLVLLHGWGMRPAVFDAMATKLRSRYTVCAMALPGYDGASSVADDVQSMAAYVAAAAPERCLVAGWSLGGEVALSWARAEPQQVERVALIATTPCFAQRDDWIAAVETRVLQDFAGALDRDTVGVLKRFATLQAQGDIGAKRVTAVLRACVSDSATDGIAMKRTLQRGLDVLLETDLRAVLGEIEPEALVIHGEKDTLVPLAAAEYLATMLRHGRLAVVPGASHAPFVSNAEAVAGLMTEFFDGR